MKLEDWETTADLNPIYADIRALGLEQNIAEHDAFGFTVVPPEKVASPEFNERLRKAILQVHARRAGEQIESADLETTTLGGKAPLAGHWALLGEDPVFEEVLLNPTVYALARYFLGKSVQLSDMVGILKRADPKATPTHPLHTDQHGTPAPLPQYAQTLNITWALTHYSREEGSVAIVPGSHRFGGMPEPYETNFLANNAPIKPTPIECDPGSLIIWGGTTWHGSFPRTAPGLRMNLILVFSRIYMKQLRDMRREVPSEVVERNSPEFAKLLGLHSLYPFPPDQKSPPREWVASFVEAGATPWS